MPRRAATLTDHARRISRAPALLADDLSRTPSLEELAAAAAYSPFHFHRAHRALLGGTPAETLARLRLAHAAALLLKTEDPTIRVARATGYGSVSAFARAFREAYGLPPGAYRRGEAIGTALLEEETMTDIALTDLPALRLAGLRHRGSYDAIGGVFDRL